VGCDLIRLDVLDVDITAVGENKIKITGGE
jgi:hypothetical protein